MGWGRTLLLGDIGNRLDIDDVERDVQSVKDYLQGQQSAAASVDERIAQLQQENHDLKIYLATLVRLLVSKSVLTTDDVSRFVNLLDR